ncbi:MAG TPA: hypothetical protein VKR58_05530, partial [Aquella sp.]|nr:hypothetical protein [Aquella sp.]
MEFPTREELTEIEVPSVFEDYQEVSPSTEFSEMESNKWVYPAMYKQSQTEGILYWRIGFDGTTNELVTEHGYHTTATGHPGLLQVDRLRVYPNNLHKTILSKAIQDASKAYND